MKRQYEPTTSTPPSPSHPNAGRRWAFQRFQCRFHPPRIQTRARGGPVWSFNTSATTTTTSLASKREPEVDFSAVSALLLPLPPPDNLPRLIVGNGKHGARPPSCSPRCKSYAVNSVRRSNYSWHCCTGIDHHLRLLNFWGEMPGGPSITLVGSSSLTSVVLHSLVIGLAIL